MRRILKLGSLPLATGLVALAAPTGLSAQGPTGTRITPPRDMIVVIGAIRDRDAPAPVVDESADSDLPELPVQFEEEAAGDS